MTASSAERAFVGFRSAGCSSISPLPPRSDIADQVRRFQRGDVAARGFEAYLPQGHNLAGAAAVAFGDSGQKPVLALIEFCPIRVIHRVAIRVI